MSGRVSRRNRSPRLGCRDDRIHEGAIVRRRRAWRPRLGDCTRGEPVAGSAVGAGARTRGCATASREGSSELHRPDKAKGAVDGRTVCRLVFVDAALAGLPRSTRTNQPPDTAGRGRSCTEWSRLEISTAVTASAANPIRHQVLGRRRWLDSSGSRPGTPLPWCSAGGSSDGMPCLLLVVGRVW
jgi:hypothetical protein